MLSRQGLYKIAGFLSLGVAILGIFLPLLPTTPLLLLAAACFSRSSERWHRWLLKHRLFGPLIHEWQQNRCMPRRAKVSAVMLMLLFGGYAVGFAVEELWIRLVAISLLVIGLLAVLRVPSCRL